MSGLGRGISQYDLVQQRSGVSERVHFHVVDEDGVVDCSGARELLHGDGEVDNTVGVVVGPEVVEGVDQRPRRRLSEVGAEDDVGLAVHRTVGCHAEDEQEGVGCPIHVALYRHGVVQGDGVVERG